MLSKGCPAVLAGAVALVLASLGPAVTAQNPLQPTKRVLLIGIDQYLAADLNDLRGCGNDIELIKATLVGKFDVPPANVMLLKDEQATRAGILAAIQEHLITKAQAGDVVLLHYSGHGSRMPDSSGDERDGWDETIVPHDSRQGAIFDINDDEINGLMRQLTAKTQHVTFILDSCHSGSGARGKLGGIAREVSPDNRVPPPAQPWALGQRGLIEGPDDFQLLGAGYVLISGCRANELSNEGSFADAQHGALTWYLAQALQAASAATTYRDVMEVVSSNVTARFADQHPEIEGAGADTEFFGSRTLKPQAYLLAEPQADGQVWVAGGKVFGMGAGDLVDIYDPGTKDFTTALRRARVRLDQVDEFSAHGRIAEGGPLQAHSRAVVRRLHPSDFYVGVHLVDQQASPAMAAMRTALHDHESVRLVATPEDALLQVRELQGQLRLEGTDVGLLASVPASEAERIVEKVAHWARWHAVLAIANPSPTMEVDLAVRRVEAGTDEPAPAEITAGEEVSVVVTNRSDREIHLVVLALASDGSITLLLPRDGVADPLPAGASWRKRLKSSLPQGREKSLDIVKVIATTQRIPAEPFRLGPTSRTAAPPPPPGEDALAAFLRRSAQGLTRNLDPVQTEGWVTRQQQLKVVRPGVRLPAYALHFDSAAATSRGHTRGLGSARTVCSQNASPQCYEVISVPGDATILQVVPPSSRGGADEVGSVGHSFEEAYALREVTGALRAEPLFDLELPLAQTAPREGTRGSSGANHDPRADNDDLWALRYMRVEEAWQRLRSLGQPAGREAAGINIGHPDTGYLKHLEIWSEDGSGPVWPEKGYDYYGDGRVEDHDPTDDLLDEQLLDNPAHGTGSASAIVSPAHCQLVGVTKCPTGIAPGARVVPLRVNRSVVQFSGRRLAQAIRDVSGEDRSRAKERAQVISISMGGVPSWEMWKAVRQAERNGVLIVAAAGNYVRTVVWPARFSSTIAVAAVNAGCRPWPHSSLGPTVDFSAPGESVWRATVAEDNRTKHVTGMGTGTTYAAATTAGVAALWVARHRGSAAFNDLRKNGDLTATFLRLARASAWRPGTDRQPLAANCDANTGWVPSLQGAGILDAAALLDLGLEGIGGTGTRSAEPAGMQDLPLWLSLYPEGNTSRAISDYRLVFRLAAADELEKVAIFEAELTHHYATDEKVAVAIDALIASPDPTGAELVRVRAALLARDLSPRLRRSLRSNE